MTYNQFEILKVLSMPEKWIYILINEVNDYDLFFISHEDDVEYCISGYSNRILLESFLKLFDYYDEKLPSSDLIIEMCWICRMALENPNILALLVNPISNNGLLWPILRRYAHQILDKHKVTHISTLSNFRNVFNDCGFDIKEVKVNYFNKLIMIFWFIYYDKIVSYPTGFYLIELEARLKSDFPELLELYSSISINEEDDPIFILQDLKHPLTHKLKRC